MKHSASKSSKSAEVGLVNGARHHILLTTPEGLREMRQHQGPWPEMPFHGDSLQPSRVPAGEAVRLGYLTLIDQVDEWERNNSGAVDGKSG